LEAVQASLSRGVLFSRNNALQHLLGEVPQLVMFLLHQQNGSGALGVEGGRAVENDLLDNLLDLLIRDGGLLLEGVDGPAALDDLEELLG